MTAASASRPRGTQRLRIRAVAAVAMCIGLLASGCSADTTGADGAASEVAATTMPTPAAPTAAASPGDIDPALLEPLTALGPCNVNPNTIADKPAEGALLPEKAVLTSQTQEGPLTQIKGYIPMTPVQIRVFYQRQNAFEVVQVEDEVRESEVLLADGTNRLFVKAQAICELGSVFLAVLAPEESGAQVPAPAGGGG